jgi:2-dehydropantoate 2-reductase
MSMKIAIVGAGAIGSYYGAFLARAGEEVHFLMRRDLEAVRRNGLTISGTGGEFHLPSVRAHASTAEIGECDLVIVAVKTTVNADLLKLLPPLLGAHTQLLTLQNGLGNEDFLFRHFGERTVLGGLCFVCLNRIAPGAVENYGHGTITLGALRPEGNEKARAAAHMFSRAGIDCKFTESLMEARWRKLVWNIPFNGLSIAGGEITTDIILREEGLLQETRGLMRETIAAARALGYAIEDGYDDFQIKRTHEMGAYRPSSLIDFQEKRPVEVEAIWGEPYRAAERARCEAPRLGLLYHLLAGYERRRGHGTG